MVYSIGYTARHIHRKTTDGLFLNLSGDRHGQASRFCYNEIKYMSKEKGQEGSLTMNEMMEFSSREDFRKWLTEYCLSEEGIWLLLGKAGGPKTLKAGEALEEALCFGWIDGQMQRIDDRSYKKYFSMRRENSKWSEKNKALTEKLEKQGLMTDYGRQK